MSVPCARARFLSLSDVAARRLKLHSSLRQGSWRGSKKNPGCTSSALARAATSRAGGFFRSPLS